MSEERRRYSVLVRTLIFSLILMAFGSGGRASDLYCPGFPTPCSDTCAPAGTPACGEGSPPPCTLGPTPICDVVAISAAPINNSTSSFSNILETTRTRGQRVVISSPTAATAVVELYLGGNMISQKVVDASLPNKLITIDLSGMESQADFYRLYLNQVPPTSSMKNRGSIGRPSVFHANKMITARLAADSLWQLSPVLEFALTSRAGGNLSMAVTNTGNSVAQNVTITGIVTQAGSAFVYEPLLLAPPFIVPGGATLNPGATTGFNLSFITAGNPSGSFSFNIIAQANNVSSFTIPIIVK